MVASDHAGALGTSVPETEPQTPATRAANNLDALRFWAALAVLWSHSIPLSQGSERNEPLFALSGGQTTIGTFSVGIFFVISGYLITQSFERSRSPWRFLQARALRILPALFVVLLVMAFVVGPLVTSLSASEYLHSADVYGYVLLQSAFLPFPELPGVFSDNPMPDNSNGSLWTLRYEVICYVAVLMLGVSRLLNRWLLLALFGAGVGFLVFYEQGQVSDGMHLMHTKHVVDLGTRFLAGALIYKWRLPLRGDVALAALAVGIGCLLFGQFATASRTVIPYLIMYLALGTSLHLLHPGKVGDLSYGIYIYAWPVKQVIVMNMTHPQWWLVASLATPIVLLLALVSWILVERVALSYKGIGFSALTRGHSRLARSH